MAPHDPFDLAALELGDARLPPAWLDDGSAKYLLGTDDQGRDILSALLYGARISLAVGVASVLLSTVIGVTLGLVSGFVGGRTDALIMRICDVMLSFPSILVALLIDGVGRALFPDAHETLAFGVLIDRRRDPRCGSRGDVRVWEQVTSGAIVSRGEGGSTAASHAANAHVLVNPKFSPFAIMQAINEELATLPVGPVRVAVGPLAPSSMAVTLAEGWRGEVANVAATDADGRWAFYRLFDPSFHNWMGLAMALRRQAISDCPLCNKSFNLSYCGHDL